MKSATREGWWNLCEQAASEQDPEKLVKIYKGITCMLDERASLLFKQWKDNHVQTKPN